MNNIGKLYNIGVVLRYINKQFGYYVLRTCIISNNLAQDVLVATKTPRNTLNKSHYLIKGDKQINTK